MENDLTIYSIWWKTIVFWGFIKKCGEGKLNKVENRVNLAMYVIVMASNLLLFCNWAKLFNIIPLGPINKWIQTRGFWKMVKKLWIIGL